ncbi:MAG: hypothetical protein KF716_17415 [Anaerolineae bacterium]|nr:hypothetical protein [Anaerolineae bacterium]
MLTHRSRFLVFSLTVLLAVAGLAFSPAQPASAEFSYSVSGTIPVGGSVDHFVTLTAGDTFSIALECPGAVIDPVVEVFDSGGNSVAFNDDGGPTTCANGFRSSLAIFSPSVTATYRVNARCFAGCGGPYVLSISGGFAGRGIPDGFVLRTITCTVAVFDSPGGSAVGDNRVLGGQTWYVNPKATKTAAGESWTEIFVSGTTNGWIPTRCVG